MRTLQDLKGQLSRFGADNDAVETARGKRMLNITPETGELLALLALLALLVHATQARQVVEVGTSNGYSTLWLAEAVIAVGGHVITLEHAEDKAALAAANFVRAGLQAHITQVPGDAGAWLETADDASVDLLFLDADRSAYTRWWPQLRRVLKPGAGLIVVDNATSHATEMADFTQAVRADMSFRCSEVSVGNGQFMAVRVAD
ncbi:SAM-dependent methlyltransferase [Xanthomonas citri pv. fuscans]|uniref:SAM-dependent methlyltransferase n=1 Tax=Xanthomonas citri pv. fuscans TaxID=366649 RepID=A0AB34Q9K3_XANCI|nr:class I SAM-dependent methyltransferase [Xanthomonas citri]ATS90132.1 class I SAM-dependent methyltransferase [Xanthomonas citri pv. phaseoli var. fuscans]AZU17655.1 SAM-dependent methyltransferase [Xanthomonas citri pv. fuscans]AZU21704.1 SAM-dependent methyltransferase [Xanthomonas citri pv. fuscans]AZU92918.1 SAM-dependent methyltransferase [Xanthomonas citri pv. fuscans]KGU40643.1 SAM-dependent methlyltransferase [Xanthomonas citri pv. fuscans]